MSIFAGDWKPDPRLEDISSFKKGTIKKPPSAEAPFEFLPSTLIPDKSCKCIWVRDFGLEVSLT